MLTVCLIGFAGSVADIPSSGAADQADLGQRAVTLTPAQMLDLGALAAERGDTDTAKSIYSALSRDPDADIRNEARFRHSQLLAAAGMRTSAAALLRQVLDEKPGATPVRLELAGLLATMGDSDGAWRQLRAAQSAGLPPAVARLVDRYSQALRASRSSGMSIELAVAPSSNINRATASDTLGTIFGDFRIGDEAKAKSGTGLAVRGQAYRRIALGSNAHLLLRAAASGDLYRHSRFNDLALDLAAGPEFRIGRSRLNVEIGATERWYGQKRFVRSARIGAVAARPLGARTQVRLRAAAAAVDNARNDLEDGASLSGEVSVERALTPTAGIAATVAVTREALKDAAYSTSGWRLGALGWKDLGRLTLTAAAEFGRLRADERLGLFPDRRSDRYTRLSIGAAFRQASVAGFAPVVRFTRERNRSSVAFYDYARSRTEFGVERAF